MLEIRHGKMSVTMGRGAAHFFGAIKGQVFNLAPKQPEQQAEYQAEYDHAGDGKVETEIFPLDDDIPGEAKQADFLQPGPRQPHNQ